MTILHLAENISGLRKNKGVTQEEMANFLNVTKASVSKWENGQSTPDIMLLPQIASYFAVSVDELLGYEPQLSKEQIQKIYHELAEEMAYKPFEEVFEKSERLVKQYYACYPFLYQICVLWLNHYMLADKEERRQEFLEKISALSMHIIENSTDAGLCSDAVLLNALVRLQCQRPEETIEQIEELLNPLRQIRQSDGILLQAYRMAGQLEKAKKHAQIIMYLQLISLVSTSTAYISMHVEEREICNETIRRILAVEEAYALEKLHPNSMAIFYYQAAAAKAVQGDKKESLHFLKKYAKLVISIVEKNSFLHGDSYFDDLDEWFGKTEQGAQMLRDKSLVLESVRQSLQNPVFSGIEGVDKLFYNKKSKKVRK